MHRAREACQQVRDYETAQADYERFDRETKTAEQEAEEIGCRPALTLLSA
ncbi:MAG: hypothetical protein ACLTNY_00135 [Blautia massiliensis (ex Durand et al. 2017)]